MKIHAVISSLMLLPGACYLADNPLRVDTSASGGGTSGSVASAGVSDGDASSSGADESSSGAEGTSTTGEVDSGTIGHAPLHEWCIDADGDGFGAPGDCVLSGESIEGRVTNSFDCYDSNPELNPDTLELTAFLPYESEPPENGEFSLSAVFFDDNGNLVPEDSRPLRPLQVLTPPENKKGPVFQSATLGRDGEIYAWNHTTFRLTRINDEQGCIRDDLQRSLIAPEPAPNYADAHKIVCGIEFFSDASRKGDEQVLYGINNNNVLFEFDPETGETSDPIPLSSPNAQSNPDIESCGMAYDCVEDRLLLANGKDRTIYELDPVKAELTVLLDLSDEFEDPWLPTGLAYDPRTRSVFLSTGSELWQVWLDELTTKNLGSLGQSVSNLQYLPRPCSPPE